MFFLLLNIICLLMFVQMYCHFKLNVFLDFCISYLNLDLNKINEWARNKATYPKSPAIVLRCVFLCLITTRANE